MNKKLTLEFLTGMDEITLNLIGSYFQLDTEGKEIIQAMLKQPERLDDIRACLEMYQHGGLSRDQWLSSQKANLGIKN